MKIKFEEMNSESKLADPTYKSCLGIFGKDWKQHIRTPA